MSQAKKSKLKNNPIGSFVNFFYTNSNSEKSLDSMYSMYLEWFYFLNKLSMNEKIKFRMQMGAKNGIYHIFLETEEMKKNISSVKYSKLKSDLKSIIY